MRRYRYRYRPSRPQAIFGALVGIGMLYFGITRVKGDTTFTIFWCLVVAGIVGMNLWSAFSPRGSLYDIDDDSTSRTRLGGRR
jgi:hypothetical protein